MSIKQIVAPAVEPLPLADVKEYLKVQNSVDDALIARLIVAGRQHIERLTGQLLIEQTWKVYLDRWPHDLQIFLPVSPVRAIVAVRFFDASAGWQQLSSNDYETDLAADIPRLVLKHAGLTAHPGRKIDGIEIDMTCGFGPTGTDVPEPLRQSILLLVADWYTNRAASESFVSRSENYSRVTQLTAPFKVKRL